METGEVYRIRNLTPHLETFLVEWKLLSVCKALKVLKVLETFLVEWKLSEYLFLFWA